MKKQILKAIGGVSLAILVLVVFAQVWVSAQDKNSDLSQNEQGLIGSWNLSVTLRDCQTGTALVNFLAMNTYNLGGTMQQSAVSNPQFRDLAGHGIWSHQTGRDYSAALQFFSVSLDGTFTGKVVVRSAISLGLRGNEYTSTDTAEVFDPNGNVIATACSTTTASRFE